jgi:transcriptional regulator with XRE-family HTH domain
MALSKLKLIRMQRGIRQFDLASRVGITEQHLSRVECGRSKPTGALLAKIAAALGVDPIDLEGSVEAGTLKLGPARSDGHRADAREGEGQLG